MEHAGIIHMNGRIYDPTLGRFLQADPFVQAPGNSQSYNRYSYVLNNPLSYTDPSGYLFKKLWKGIKKAAGFIAAAVVGVYCQTCSIWVLGAVQGAIDATVNGGNILQGALLGAFTAGVPGSEWYKGLSSIGKDLVSIGLSSLDRSFERSQVGEQKSKDKAAEITQAHIVAGSYSNVTGGKFANGAVTGAFSRGFNDEAHKTAKDREIKKALFDKTRKIGLNVSIPSKIVDFFGGDTDGHDVGFEFGLVFGSDGDIGAYYSQFASKGLSVPFSGSQLPISRVGGFITFGQQQGGFYDFAGTGDFVSAGVGPLVIDGTLSDSGKYGLNVNLGGGFSCCRGEKQYYCD